MNFKTPASGTFNLACPRLQGLAQMI